MRCGEKKDALGAKGAYTPRAPRDSRSASLVSVLFRGREPLAPWIRGSKPSPADRETARGIGCTPAKPESLVRAYTYLVHFILQAMQTLLD